MNMYYLITLKVCSYCVCVSGGRGGGGEVQGVLLSFARYNNGC